MKTAGIICFVFAGLNLIVMLMAAFSGETEAVGTQFNGFLMAGVLGAFFISRANKNKKEKEEKEKWSKGE